MTVAASPAWTTPSGQHLIITPNARTTPNPGGTPRILLYLGWGCTFATILDMVIIAIATFELAPHPGLLILLGLVAVISGVAAALSLIAAVSSAGLRQHQTRVMAPVAERVADLEREDRAVLAAVAGLADLPVELRDRVDRHAAGYQQVVREVEQRQTEQARQVLRRLEAIENTLSGSVVLISQIERGEGDQVNGSRPSGLDAEAISMAREFSERIRRLERDS